MQEYLIKQVGEKMKERLDSLQADNIEFIEKEFQSYFDFLKSLVALPCTLTLPVAAVTASQEESRASTEKSEEIPAQITETKERQAYKFERKLKGGFLPDIKAVVPEKTIRMLGIKHGDLLYAELQPTTNIDGSPKYHYSIAQAKGGELKDRVELSYCIVEYDASLGSFVVNRMGEGKLIRIDEVPQTIVLLDNDVQELNLVAGDIVDIAYLKSNPLYRRVVWKYNVNEGITSSPKSPSNVRNDREKREKKEYEPIFQDKTILMLGNEPERAEFEEEVTARGGQFLFLSGNERKDTMSATLAKADAAVFMLQHVSHDATNWAKDVCKSYEIPFKGTHSFGKNSFVRTAEELLNGARLSV